MTTRLASVAWLAVAGYGLYTILVVDEGDDWELAYTGFMVALLIGVVLTISVAARATNRNDRPRLRLVGLALCGLGAVASIVAWALPLWMTILGLGFTLLAVADHGRRRVVAILAAGQLAGIATVLAGNLAEIGRQDEWGDHPAAGGIALLVTGALTIAALTRQVTVSELPDVVRMPA